MPRKSMKNRHGRPGTPFLRGDILVDITPVSCTRTVLMSNGSGYRTITVDGTPESVWTWTTRRERAAASSRTRSGTP